MIKSSPGISIKLRLWQSNRALHTYTTDTGMHMRKQLQNDIMAGHDWWVWLVTMKLEPMRKPHDVYFSRDSWLLNSCKPPTPFFLLLL